MAADDPKFSCTGCGKEYRWKPELAGRKAKCGCGAALVVPAERPAAKPALEVAPPPPPPAPVAPASALREAAVQSTAPAAAPSSAACPACGAALAANAVLCVNCGYNLKTGHTLSVVVERDEEQVGAEGEAAAPPAKTPAAPPAGPAAKSARPAT